MENKVKKIEIKERGKFTVTSLESLGISSNYR